MGPSGACANWTTQELAGSQRLEGGRHNGPRDREVVSRSGDVSLPHVPSPHLAGHEPTPTRTDVVVLANMGCEAFLSNEQCVVEQIGIHCF